MLTKEDLQAISQLIKNEVEPINKRLDNMDQRLYNMDQRLDRMEEDIAIIKEDGQITREVTNDIGEWVDFYFHEDKPYPIDKDEIEKQKKAMRFAD